MDKYIERVLKRGLGNILDKDMNKLAFSDKTYQRHSKLEDEYEKKYLALDLNQRERMIIDDYIECIYIRNARGVELAFFAGIRDTVKFLNGLGLLKRSKGKLALMLYHFRHQ